MQAVYEYVRDNFLIWIIIGLASYVGIKEANKQKWGAVIGIVLIASFCYYFVKNPQTVLDFVSKIFQVLFGG